MNGHGARRLLGLAPDAFWTLAHNVLSVAGALAVVKIISSLVPADQYGQASLALGIITLLTQLIIFPLLTAHLRVHFDELRRGGGTDFMRSLTPLLLKASLAMACLYLVIALFQWWSGRPAYLMLLVPAWLLIFVQPRMSATLNSLESRRKYRSLGIADVLSKIAPVGFLLLLLATSLSRAGSILLAQGLALASVALIFRPRREGAGAQEAGGEPAPARSRFEEYGWTLHLFSVVSWIMTTSDRYLIELSWSAAEVGLYAMNYGLCAMPFLMLSAWLDILVRSRLYARAAAADWKGVRTILLGRMAMATGLAIAGAVLFALIGERIALLILGSDYWQGMRLAMVLIVAHAFFVAANSFHILFVAAKRTDLLLGATLVAAAANVGCNLYLVPSMGIRGAAISTLVAYIVLCAGMFAAGFWLLRRLTTAGPGGAASAVSEA